MSLMYKDCGVIEDIPFVQESVLFCPSFSEEAPHPSPVEEDRPPLTVSSHHITESTLCELGGWRGLVTYNKC